MKNKLIIGIIISFIIVSSLTVYAGENSITLETEKTKVDVGETFTVKIKAVVPDGINGIFTTYNYNTKKLEIVEKKLIDSNFVDLGGATLDEIAVMFNPEDPSAFTKVTETDLYELTFKTKQKSRGTATIAIEKIELSTLAGTNSEHKEPRNEITIEINGKSQIQASKIIIIIAIIIIGVIFAARNNSKKKVKNKL